MHEERNEKVLGGRGNGGFSSHKKCKEIQEKERNRRSKQNEKAHVKVGKNGNITVVPGVLREAASLG